MVAAAPPAPQITSQPTPKVIGAAGGSAVGAALATLITWAFDNYHLLSAQPLPSKVQDSLTVIISAIFTFLAGYYVRPSPTEIAHRQGGRTFTAIRI